MSVALWSQLTNIETPDAVSGYSKEGVASCRPPHVYPIGRHDRGEDARVQQARYGTLGGGTSETLRDLIEDHGRGGYRR